MYKATGLSGRLFVFTLVFGLAPPEWSIGFEEPSVNLGASTFFDGMAVISEQKADSGFYFNQYFQYYSANRFNDSQGSARPGAPDLYAYTSLTQLIYLMEKPEVLGGKLGIDALIPLVSLKPSPDNTMLNANPQVLGDLSIGPAIQFNPIMHGTNPLFMHRIDLDVIVPTGAYDRQFAFNPGANFVSFNPYWAASLFLGSKIVTSCRIHYLWNDVNKQPDLALYPPGTKQVQAGQAVHFNYDLAYALFDHRLYAGFNGYYLKQFTPTKINDVAVSGLEEQVLGLGPGAVFNLNENAHFYLNLYFETAVENRSSGTRLNALFTYHF